LGPSASASIGARPTDIVSLILHADPVVWAVLASLLFFSAMSWAIIVFKRRQLTQAAKQTAAFMGVFRKSSRFSEVQSVCAKLSASLGVVAPGIAEALVATAAGLFAAIPAVYFYNDLTSRVKAFANEMEDFSMEFLTIAERNFT
jgi:biopolymer transport protein ExbB/TolQ